MRLKSVSYSESLGKPKEWSISNFTLEPINLVVGKNATGKTRTLNVLSGLGMLLSGRQKPSELTYGNFDVTFEHNDHTFNYILKISDHKVVFESFADGKNVLLERGEGGKGSIWHEKEKRSLEFQTPETDAAVVARRDTIQHTFLIPLSDWGSGVRYYSFGDTMGRNTISFLVDGGPQPDPTNPNEVIGLFRKGTKEYPDIFKKSVIKAMNDIGYDIEDINATTPQNIQIQSNSIIPVTPIALIVKERSLSGATEQMEMSQGMFRALSVIIHLQYAIHGDHPSFIIIDDIGEGLDFDRSCRLIHIIRQCALDSKIQMVMSTNDRFVMNNVPLEEWALLSREGGNIMVHNYTNSKATFDNFKFTGLNNFDFLAMDFINENEVFFAENPSDVEQIAGTHS
ncbi:MAG: ATP-binding protein [Pseudanabaena sp. CAN_BIN31]|nr:ATP-binding protein [Pseudanabaena sp. CAN_BIN31]